MHRLLLPILSLFITSNVQAQPQTDPLLEQLLRAGKGSQLQQVLDDPQTYRCQIIYTRIDRDSNNTPSFTNYYFNHDPFLYFNPASTVKMPLAFLALEKLNDLRIAGVNKFTTIQFDSSYAGQSAVKKDTTARFQRASIAHYIKRAFLISENDPYNRLYQFLGQRTIHRNLHGKGYTDTRIVRQFQPFTANQNRHTNGLRFLSYSGTTLYRQPPAYNTDSIHFGPQVLLGNAHYNRNDSLVQAPFDFTQHNNLPLHSLQQMLQSVLFPASVPAYQRFRLREDDYSFLYRWLSQYPSETDDPKYDTAKFYDSYVKFFFRDSTRRMPPNVRVFNKVGWSYGFLTDVSYVMDTANKVEYMLAATLYVNSDGILNDGKYDYNTIGYPFLYQLGQTIYQHELQRQRTYKPDFTRFKIRYDQRNPKDQRPSLKEVDN